MPAGIHAVQSKGQTKNPAGIYQVIGSQQIPVNISPSVTYLPPGTNNRVQQAPPGLQITFSNKKPTASTTSLSIKNNDGGGNNKHELSNKLVRPHTHSPMTDLISILSPCLRIGFIFSQVI